MANTPERATVRRRESGAVIDMPAQIDATTEATLENAYAEVAGTGALLLNFTGTSYINSSGIALIVSILARARRDGRRVSAYGLSEHYREIFEVTRLADYIGLFPDERAAAAG